MVHCAACGEENRTGARFCNTCGTPLHAPASPPREVRKTVTVLFIDVTGSTALGERLDPESLRTVMGRYFGAMKTVIERHGGTVEKFIGDAVMAVFGIPTLHEDDALRAVRAAAEMRQALDTLNRELGAQRGVTIVTRTGINTGEVVAGDPSAGQTLVTGDTVNTAARLEQAAAPGEILLGEPTYRLVRDAVRVEPVPPVDAKGKSLPVPAVRLLSVTGGVEGRSRRLDAPLVGREDQMALLRNVFDRCIREHSSQLFTLLGTAGVGKSRLTAEFLASVAGEAQVLKGRCLPYGEGITYWPLGEVVRAASGVEESDSAEDAQVKLRSLLEGERDAEVIAQRVASAIGLSTESAPQEEIFWATRKLLEHVARTRPLVVLWEDIHWAEPTFLDLVEHIADLSRDAPLLLLCPARPELLDTRTGWGGGKLNATTVLLEPLPPEATERLIESLPGGSALPPDLRARILEGAEGNPVYLEEMLAMLLEEGLIAEAAGGWQAVGDLTRVRVPPSIQALLAARLAQLGPDERAIAEHASVVGRVFEQAAVTELASDLRPSVSRGLVALVRKELVRPDRSELSAGDAFKFRHILIRDAALRRGDETLAAVGETNSRSSVVALLAEALARQGRYEEAAVWAETARGLSPPDDFYPQALWRIALALCRAAQGDPASGESLAREAVTITEQTTTSTRGPRRCCDSPRCWRSLGERTRRAHARRAQSSSTSARATSPPCGGRGASSRDSQPRGVPAQRLAPVLAQPPAPGGTGPSPRRRAPRSAPQRSTRGSGPRCGGAHWDRRRRAATRGARHGGWPIRRPSPQAEPRERPPRPAPAPSCAY